MHESVSDLLRYIDGAPTPYHAVARSAERLEAAGFEQREEGELWDLSPGDRCWVERGGGSLIAFEVGSEAPAEAGFRWLGAHTDSPNLRLKPRADLVAHGYRQLAVEPYGGLLLHTWLDRDLSLAGRVSLRGPDGLPRTRLVDLERPLLRVPNLAIHLDRTVATDGLKLDRQKHAVPVCGLEDAPPLAELLVAALARDGIEAAPEDVLAFDLMLYDVEPARVIGARDDFVCASRLDNLASCHAAVCALVACAGRDTPFTRGIVLYDHEEVGSRSATGAAGSFLLDVLERCADGFKGGSPQALARARARSMLISVDMAHAVHPNYPDRHEPGHQPVIGAGPVLKLNQDQAYASDAVTSARFAALCEAADVPLQHFVTRSDLACGSTIGPISAARVGFPTVDVGNPMLSMHSCRELAGTADVAPLIEVLTGFLRSP